MTSGRKPVATGDQIIAAYQKSGSLSQACRELHVGYKRAARILADAGIERYPNDADKPIGQHETHKFVCWKCGVEVPSGEIFCGDQHRREYNAAAIRPGFDHPHPVHHRRKINAKTYSATA